MLRLFQIAARKSAMPTARKWHMAGYSYSLSRKNLHFEETSLWPLVLWRARSDCAISHDTFLLEWFQLAPDGVIVYVQFWWLLWRAVDDINRMSMWFVIRHNIGTLYTIGKKILIVMSYFEKMPMLLHRPTYQEVTHLRASQTHNSIFPLNTFYGVELRNFDVENLWH